MTLSCSHGGKPSHVRVRCLYELPMRKHNFAINTRSITMRYCHLCTYISTYIRIIYTCWTRKAVFTTLFNTGIYSNTSEMRAYNVICTYRFYICVRFSTCESCVHVVFQIRPWAVFYVSCTRLPDSLKSYKHTPIEFLLMCALSLLSNRCDIVLMYFD